MWHSKFGIKDFHRFIVITLAVELDRSEGSDPIADGGLLNANVDSWARSIAANRRSEADDTDLNALTVDDASDGGSWVAIATVATILNDCAEHSVGDVVPEARAGGVGENVLGHFEEIGWQAAAVGSSPSGESGNQSGGADAAAGSRAAVWKWDRAHMRPASEWRVYLMGN